MPKIELVINNCSECPFIKQEKYLYYNPISNTVTDILRIHAYICGKLNKVVKCYKGDTFIFNEMPNWCPLEGQEKDKLVKNFLNV
jgi:hypothetical protein